MNRLLKILALVSVPSSSINRLLLWLAGFSICVLLHASNSYCANSSDTDRKAVRSGASSVWCDPETEQPRMDRSITRRVDVSDRNESLAPDDNSGSWSWWDYIFGTGKTSKGSSGMTSFFQGLFEGWKILLLIALIVLFSTLIFLFIRYGGDWAMFTRSRTVNSDNDKRDRERAKIVDLPFEIDQSMLSLMEQAQQYREQGNYSKAIIYLFSYALVEMDSARCIRLERGKTNGAYVRELRSREQLRGFTKQLVHAFEFAFFGRHTLPKEAFEKLWAQVPAFDRYLQSIQSGDSSVEPLSGLQ